MKDPSTQPDIHWRGVWIGFAVSLGIGLAAGLPLTALTGSVWWLAVASLIGLFVGALAAARLAGSSEPLNGAMIVLLHFSTLALVYFPGQALELLPDPLPGLPADDSTFFFVWPIGQIVLGTLGSLVGGMRRGG